jgi:hypothetical protein
MVVAAAGEFASDYEFQFVAGTFHEDIGDLAAATKDLLACSSLIALLTTTQVLLHMCKAQSQGRARNCSVCRHAASASAGQLFGRAIFP